jgi:biopolymer transport protein ExbB
LPVNVKININYLSQLKKSKKMEILSTVNLLNINVNADTNLSFLDLAMKGGWIMIPLVILSIIAVYIFIERFMAIKKAANQETLFMNTIKEHISNGKIDSALSVCKATEGPLARMIEKGITRLGKPLEDINTAIENVGKLEVYKLEKGLPTLATIAGGAPMIGFLGTVLGMIRAFYDMANAGNNLDVSLLSSGIYTALVTTVTGLIVGIVAYFAYNILVSRVEKVINKLEGNSTEFMDLLNEPVN